MDVDAAVKGFLYKHSFRTSTIEVFSLAVKVKNEECVGCGACEDVCPQSAIKIENDIAVINEKDCVDCGACVDECPNSAISMD